MAVLCAALTAVIGGGSAKYGFMAPTSKLSIGLHGRTATEAFLVHATEVDGVFSKR